MRLRSLFAVLLLPAFAAAQDKLDFETFTFKTQGFSVLLPGTPKEQTNKVPSALGELTLKNFVVETHKGKAAWLISCTDYPAGTVKADNQDAILDAGASGAAQGVKGKLINQTKIMLDKKYPGRAIQVDAPNFGLYVSRIYLVGDRLYQIVVLGPKDVATSPEATKYLESFKLVK